MKKERVFPNPLISICLSPKERKYIKQFATDYGISEAQIARGLLRLGVKTLAIQNESNTPVSVIKLGAL